MQGRSHKWDFSVGLKDHINKLAADVCIPCEYFDIDFRLSILISNSWRANHGSLIRLPGRTVKTRKTPKGRRQ